MADIVFDHVSKHYEAEKAVIKGLDLHVGDGEFLVLVGPSGSGKSSALRMIAGLEEVTGGQIRIGGRDVTHVSPKDRDIAMVFQSYALYPHKTVRKNMSFALELAGIAPEERDRRVRDAAELLGLVPYLDRKPGQLSGGQRQRVAMGRAIVREPQAFLMDEPLSNLDAKLRVSMRAAIAALHKNLRVTTVYVTHDQVEAMTLGDRVAVLHDGVLQQLDTPQTLFDRPANLFVASFIGTPTMNFAEARLTADDGLKLVWGSQVTALPPSSASRFTNLSTRIGQKLILGVRPHDLVVVEGGGGDLRAVATTVETLGSGLNVVFPVDAHGPDGAVASVDLHEDEAIISGSDARTIWTASLDPRLKTKVGDELSLAIHTDGLHLFDAIDGRSLLA